MELVKNDAKSNCMLIYFLLAHIDVLEVMYNFQTSSLYIILGILTINSFFVTNKHVISLL